VRWWRKGREDLREASRWAVEESEGDQLLPRYAEELAGAPPEQDRGRTNPLRVFSDPMAGRRWWLSTRE
jgi:hypothetical protein